MQIAHAVRWEDADAGLFAGKLELCLNALRFEGTNGRRRFVREIPYRDIGSVEMTRGPSDRLDGRPTLVLTDRNGVTARVADLTHTGVVAEVAAHLASVQRNDAES
jgi:hypothetical protein